MIWRAAILAATLSVQTPSIAADSKATGAAKGQPRKACDPTKVHTGPRGGKYYYTKHCTKVYLRR